MNVEHPTPNVEHRSEQKRKVSSSLGEGRYDLEERLLEYAARIIQLVEMLPQTRSGHHLGNQLLRSGTAPLLNHGEAQAAESRKDFIHKTSICLKELRESHRTLRLIHRIPISPW
jgi:four helix bundle protein